MTSGPEPTPEQRAEWRGRIGDGWVDETFDAIFAAGRASRTEPRATVERVLLLLESEIRLAKPAPNTQMTYPGGITRAWRIIHAHRKDDLWLKEWQR